MKLEANIKRYYLFKFLRLFSFWVPIFVIYFLDKGMNYTQLMFFGVSVAACQIAFEVPSGVFADYYGRKNSLAIAAVSKIIAMFFFLFGNTFSVFMIGWGLIGVSIAFESGSDSAFMYDTLRDLKREKDYKKVEGKAFSYGLLALGVGSFFGGFLADVSFKIPVLLTIVAFTGSLIAALTLVEPKHHKKSEDRNYFKHLKKATVFAYNHPKVKWLTVFSGLMLGALIISQKFYQPYMQAANIDIKFFGIIYLVWLLVSAAASHYAHNIEAKLGKFWSLMIVPIFVGLHLIFLGNQVIFYGIIVILLGQFSYGFIRPVVSYYVNKETASHHRATVLSLKGFFKSVILIVLAPIIGYLADALSLQTALLIEGIFALAIGIPVAFMILRTYKKIPAAA